MEDGNCFEKGIFYLQIIISNVTTKFAQENLGRAQKVRSHQHQVSRRPVYSTCIKDQATDETCRFNNRSILYETVEAPSICRGRIQNKHCGSLSFYLQAKIIEGDEQKSGVMAKPKDLGDKLSEKLQFR